MNNRFGFLDFLNSSPTSIQASHEIVKAGSGFKALKKEQWALQVGSKIMFVMIPVL